MGGCKEEAQGAGLKWGIPEWKFTSIRTSTPFIFGSLPYKCMLIPYSAIISQNIQRYRGFHHFSEIRAWHTKKISKDEWSLNCIQILVTTISNFVTAWKHSLGGGGGGGGVQGKRTVKRVCTEVLLSRTLAIASHVFWQLCKKVARARQQILFLLGSEVLMEGDKVTKGLQIKAYVRQGNLLSQSSSSMPLINVS